MLEIRFHGRGGQGAVTAAVIFAKAAFLEGKEVQSFPQFGVERRGAPVAAFCRIDTEPIIIHSNVYKPDCVVVLDISLVKAINVVSGLKENGWLILNTNQPPEAYEYLLVPSKVEGGISRVAVIDATGIAISKKLGSENAPIVNTTILGAVAKATGTVKIESVLAAIKEEIGQKIEENLRACEEAYVKVQIKIFDSKCEKKGGEDNG